MIEDGDAIRRRRSCTACGQRFTTFERVERAPLLVRKRDGDRQPYVGAKVQRGIELAVKGRPIASEQVMTIVARVEAAIRASTAPFPTEQIGDLVLDSLKELDPVAALRFASVYKHFEDLSDFEKAASELSEP